MDCRKPKKRKDFVWERFFGGIYALEGDTVRLPHWARVLLSRALMSPSSGRGLFVVNKLLLLNWSLAAVVILVVTYISRDCVLISVLDKAYISRDSVVLIVDSAYISVIIHFIRIDSAYISVKIHFIRILSLH